VITILLAVALIQAETSPDGRLVLWNNLRAGMSKAEFKALWPVRRTELGDGCFADIGAEFNRGKLEAVTLEYIVKDNERCADVVSSSLASKYGEPVAIASDTQVGSCGNEYAGGLAGALAGLCKGLGGEDPKTSRIYRWIKDGVEITFRRSTENEYEWYLVYRAAVQPSDAVKSNL
jgi:hypothetical protein